MKKIVILTMLLIMTVCTLSACAHEHTWGSWTTLTEPTYSTNGVQHRYCVECNVEETQVIQAYGDQGILTRLSGHWKEQGKSNDTCIDVEFHGSTFTATVYIGGVEFDMLNGSGKVEITDDLIVLKEYNGDTYSYYAYEVIGDSIELIEYDLKKWERYTPEQLK